MPFRVKLQRIRAEVAMATATPPRPQPDEYFMKHDIRKRLDGKVGGSDLLIDCPLKHTEVPKSREQSSSNAGDRWFGPMAGRLSFIRQRCQGSLEILYVDVHQTSRLHRNKNFSDGIVK